MYFRNWKISTAFQIFAKCFERATSITHWESLDRCKKATLSYLALVRISFFAGKIWFLVGPLCRLRAQREKGRAPSSENLFSHKNYYISTARKALSRETSTRFAFLFIPFFFFTSTENLRTQNGLKRAEKISNYLIRLMKIILIECPNRGGNRL